MPFTPRTILVYSGLELVGDAFLKLTFLRAIRGTWPDAHVTWLAGKGRSVFATFMRPAIRTYIDEVIDDGGVGSDISELFRRRPLPGRKFDLILDTQRRVLTTLILRRIRHDVFVSGAMNYRLSERRPNIFGRKPPNIQHQLFDLVRVASDANPVLAPRPVLPAVHDANAVKALPAGPQYVGLVPGAGDRRKCWPLEQYVGLARLLLTRSVRPVFLLGPAEEEWLAHLKEAAPGSLFPLQDRDVPAHIASSPFYTMAVGKRLDLAVTNDCGTSHMLAAVDAPLICLFGPTNAEKFAPPCARTVLRAQNFAAQQNRSDMHNIPLSAVIAAVDRLLGIG